MRVNSLFLKLLVKRFIGLHNATIEINFMLVKKLVLNILFREQGEDPNTLT